MHEKYWCPTLSEIPFSSKFFYLNLIQNKIEIYLIRVWKNFFYMIKKIGKRRACANCWREICFLLLPLSQCPSNLFLWFEWLWFKERRSFMVWGSDWEKRNWFCAIKLNVKSRRAWDMKKCLLSYITTSSPNASLSFLPYIPSSRSDRDQI